MHQVLRRRPPAMLISMSTDISMPTDPTGLTLQRLGELAAERNGDRNTLLFEGATWTGSQLAERARRVSAGAPGGGPTAGGPRRACMADSPPGGLTHSPVRPARPAAAPLG